MARMHSGAHGKSGSKKPLKRIPSWAPYKEKEVEKLIIKYAKAGKTASQIGMILRDNYGIHSVRALTNKKLLGILTENKVAPALPEDILSLIKKMIAIKQHLEKNKHDQPARRGLLLTTSKIHRLSKHYQRTGRLAAGWQLDTERLKMYLQ